MKKIVLLLIILIGMTATGCTLMAKTPSDVVSKYLNKYKNNETVVINELNEFLDQDEELDEDTKEDYREIYLRQYSNMKYEIKDETIDGDTAEVKVQITVFDYYKTNSASGEYFTSNQDEFIDEDGDVDMSKYITYKIKELLDTTDTVDYTLNITLQKVDDEWEVNPLTSDDLSKIHGTYEY